MLRARARAKQQKTHHVVPGVKWKTEFRPKILELAARFAREQGLDLGAILRIAREVTRAILIKVAEGGRFNLPVRQGGLLPRRMGVKQPEAARRLVHEYDLITPQTHRDRQQIVQLLKRKLRPRGTSGWSR